MFCELGTQFNNLIICDGVIDILIHVLFKNNLDSH